MKKTLLVITCLFLSLFWAYSSQAQTSFVLQSKGVEDDHFVTIKGDDIRPNEKHVYMFSNLGYYRIKIKHPHKESNHVVVRILDQNNKEIASNYNPDTKTYNHHFDFKCGRTGMYYLAFEEMSN
ncbi:MAG: hypothetical protein NW226_04835 [Microscillaceae bacterium]|nr:hypothetical protein [Microscillaceae bacterium]